jgi:tRNA (Thr-GGU) A37 N-methylase
MDTEIRCLSLLEINVTTGALQIDAVESFEGAPVLDITPWRASVYMPRAGTD